MNNHSSIDQPDSQILLNKILLEMLKEQRRQRRARWFKGLLSLIIIGLIVYFFISLSYEDKPLKSKGHIGVVDLNGAIFDTQTANSENFAKGVQAAYKNESLKALIIRINSPGGSPVQADYMYNILHHFREKYPQIKTYAVCVDICASAAYYVATATDEIYASPSSLVGSIGVLFNGFGFVDTLQKLGITRRLHTAGKNKAFLDPFSPESPEQEQLLQTMLDDIHQEFIAKVTQGRGQRLKIDDQTFSGLFWTGKQAKSRGLIDGFASSGQLARDIIGIDAIVDYTYKPGVLERLGKNIGTAMADEMPMALGLHRGVQE